MHSQLQTHRKKINHFMYLDNIKLFYQKRKRIGNPNTNCENILLRNRNGIWHRKMCHASNEKWQMTHDRSQTTKSSSHQNARRKGNIQILGNIGSWWAETKEKIKKEYLRRTRKLLETKLYSRNLVKGIKTWVVPLIRYSGPFLNGPQKNLNKWTRTRKLMTMHKALHPKDDDDRLYVSRREWERGLASIEDSADASIQQLEDYTEKHRGRLIAATRNNTNDTRTNGTTITRKQKSEEKQLYGLFRQLTNISHEKTWTWLRKGNLKRETESLLIAAQNNAIRTNHIKARIDKTQQNSKCKLCGDRHIISECSKLAQRV